LPHKLSPLKTLFSKAAGPSFSITIVKNQDPSHKTMVCNLLPITDIKCLYPSPTIESRHVGLSFSGIQQFVTLGWTTAAGTASQGRIRRFVTAMPAHVKPLVKDDAVMPGRTTAAGIACGCRIRGFKPTVPAYITIVHVGYPHGLVIVYLWGYRQNLAVLWEFIMNSRSKPTQCPLILTTFARGSHVI
jgi:hypothetical protein